MSLPFWRSLLPGSTAVRRSAHARAGALLAFLLLLPLACTEGGDPSGPRPRNPSALALVPSFAMRGSSSAIELPINRIRLTAHNAFTGGLVDSLTRDGIDPDASEWSLEFEIALPSAEPFQVVVTVELINVDNAGLESVQWSGRTEPVTVEPGKSNTPASVNLFPGPVENLAVTSIVLQPTDVTAAEGDSVQLHAQATGAGDVSKVQIFWTSLDPEVATVGPTGIVRLLKPGTSRIIAEAGASADTVTVQARARLVGARIAPDSIILNSIGSDAVFTVTAFDPRGAEIAGQSFTWSIVDPAVAENLGNGRFRAVGDGRTEVVATLSGGSITDRAVLVVTQRAARVVVSPNEAALHSIGSTHPFTAVVTDANGQPIHGNVVWRSSVDSVAMIDDNGVATARRNGFSEIRAVLGAGTSDSVFGTARLYVNQRVHSISIDPATWELSVPGDTVRLRAVALDSRGVAIPNVAVRWSTADSTIVRVDENGLVTALAAGHARIAATIDEITADAGITVLIGSRPNLRVDDFVPVTDTVHVGDTAGVVLRIRNSGSAASPAGSMRMQVISAAGMAIFDGVLAMPSVSAGDTAMIAWPFVIDSQMTWPDSIRFAVQLDHDNAIAESDESDNLSQTQHVHIRPAPVNTPAGMVVLSGLEQHGVAGQTLPDSLIVKVVDSAGNPVSGISVRWYLNIPHEARVEHRDPLDGVAFDTVTPPAYVTTTDALGRTGILWQLPIVAGEYEAHAVVSGLDYALFLGAALPAALHHVRFQQDSVVLTNIGEVTHIPAFPYDQYGNEREDVIDYRSLDTTVVTINSHGELIPHAAGQTFVIASTGAFADTLFVEVRVALPGGLSIVSGNNQTGIVGQPLADSLVVLVTDSTGAPMPGVPVTWTGSGLGVDGAVLPDRDPTPLVTMSDAHGRASVQWTLTTNAWPQYIFVTTFSHEVMFYAEALPDVLHSFQVYPDTMEFRAIGDSDGAHADPLDRYGNHRDDPITWTSLDPGIATVDTAGNVVSVSNGIARIVGAVGTMADTLIVNVRQQVYTVEFVTANDTLAVGASRTLVVNQRDPNGVLITDSAVASRLLWQSQDTTIAKVDSLGTVTAVAPGFTVILVRSANNTLAVAAANILVRAVNLTLSPIALTPADSVTPGDSITVTMSVLNAGTSPTPATSLRVELLNATDGAILLNAMLPVPALAPGASQPLILRVQAPATIEYDSLQIRAIIDPDSMVTESDETDNQRVSAALRGIFAVSSIELDPRTVSFDAFLLQTQITATPKDAFSRPISRPVTWSVRDSGIATVDSTGTITARGNGQTYVIASSGAALDSVSVNVDQVATAFEIIPDSLMLVPGDSTLLHVNAHDSQGHAIARPITWTTSNAAVAEINALRWVFSRAAGSAWLTGEINGLRDSVRVNVLPLSPNTRLWLGHSSDWNDPANWSPMGVPLATDTVLIRMGGSTATLSSDVTLDGLIMDLGASADVGAYTLGVRKLDSHGSIGGSGTVRLSGGPVRGAGGLPNVEVVGNVDLIGPMIVNKRLTLNGGELRVGQNYIHVAGRFHQDGGVLVMTDSMSVVDLDSTAVFEDGNTEGKLIAGVLMIAGDFSAGSYGRAFAPSGRHHTLLDGSGRVQNAGMASPGIATTDQHFQNLVINNMSGVTFTTPVAIAGDLLIAPGVTAVTSTQTVELGGSMYQSANEWQVAETVLTGNNIYLPATLTTDLVFTGNSVLQSAVDLTGNFRVHAPASRVELAGQPLNISGELNILGGTFAIGASTVGVGGDLEVTGTDAALEMTSFAGVLNVAGDAEFTGGVSGGRLSAGTIDIKGAFSAAGSGSSFSASGGHAVVFSGSALQSISLTHADSAAGGQHFANLVLRGTPGVQLSGPIYVNNRLLAVGGGDAKIAGDAVHAFDVDADHIVFDGAPLFVGAGPMMRLDTVRFQNMSPIVSQLTVRRGPGTVQFSNLSFLTMPTTGYYIDVINTGDATGAPLIVQLPGVSPTGPSNKIRLVGAQLSW